MKVPASPHAEPPSRSDPLVRDASEAVGGPAGRHARGHPFWTPVRVVLAVVCVTWLLAMAQKAPCAADGWSGEDSRYAQLCYSDIPYLYVGRGFAERAVPYRDTDGRWPDLEYPVLVGYLAWTGAAATHGLHGWPDLAARTAVPADQVYAVAGVESERQDYFWVTAALLVPFVLAAAYFLAGAHRGRPWDAMGFAAAPALVLTGLVNWDLLAVACTAGAFWAWARGRPVLTGILLGLGTAAKLYPVLVVGALLVVALRRRRLADLARVVAGGVAAWTAVNLPALVDDPEAWRGFWSFNQDRGPDLGSLWLLASQLGHPASAETVNRVSFVAFAAICVGVLILGLRARHAPRVAQLAFLVLVGFLLVNKVYSPQYVLWLLPVAALAVPRWRDLLVWQAGEAFYFVMVWMHLGGFTASATAGSPDAAYLVAIVVRVLAQLYLAGVVVREVLRPEHDAARRHPDDDPMTPAGPAGGDGQTPTMRSNVLMV